MSSGIQIEGRDPLQKHRISVVVFISLVCRAAIEGGLSPEVACPLGDSYIEAAMQSRDPGELNKLSLSMYHDFIYRVHSLKADPDYSAAIRKCCDYIEFSVGRDIRIADLPALTGYTEYYLSEKFRKETGTPVFLYIRCAKIERAKLLPESTSLSVREITEALAFNTPNYFSKCFREIAGCTPAQYRKQHALRIFLCTNLHTVCFGIRVFEDREGGYRESRQEEVRTGGFVSNVFRRMKERTPLDVKAVQRLIA